MDIQLIFSMAAEYAANYPGVLDGEIRAAIFWSHLAWLINGVFFECAAAQA